MRSIWTGVSAALLVIGLARLHGRRNGLERFEKEIQAAVLAEEIELCEALSARHGGLHPERRWWRDPGQPGDRDKESTVKIQR